ncbi:homing endonuclease associated repeat-containing protein [Haloferax gibbonsii]|uniref:homing endonuclease associated repeat-containing protein n=1 Tax=Haloferax gibbonsii TaxID=35746 RepID=UPI002F3EC210
MLYRFQRKYESLGRMPVYSELDNIGGYSHEEYIDEFGSVYGTAVLAGMTGIDPDQYNHDADGSKQYSEWDLISEIWRIHESAGTVSIRMMDYAGRYSSQTYKYRFGSWSKALQTAHLNGPEPSVEASRDSRQKHYSSSEWRELRSRALKRDDYQCQSCGMSEETHQERFGVGLNVHHLTDIADFENPKDADSLENLECLCVECHGTHHPFSKE